jgi:uncharacterized protein
MSFDALIAAIAAADEMPEAAVQALLDGWDAYGPRCRALLHAYVSGQDLSEQTEIVLFTLVHLMGEKADTASFADLCALAGDADRLESVLGLDAATLSFPLILVSTFGGDPAPLHALIENAAGDDIARGDALLVLAYLARTERLAERGVYDYLAALPARLRPAEPHLVWFGYARAVAALGFAGLSGAVESAISRGFVAADLMSSADFWSDLRDSQQNPQDFSSPIWDGLEPFDNAIEHLRMFSEDAEQDGPEADYFIAEPVRNPLRNVGRNDPCPCGSGKKFKKCCLDGRLA